ncbi:MAG: hypothetical protein ACRDNF_05465 [Streptosporangiaceae bacterium]
MRQGLPGRAIPALAAGLTALVLATGLAASAPALGSVTAGRPASGRPAAGPRLRLIVAQHRIDLPRFGQRVVVDPGIWVGALGRALRIDAGRVSYTRPVTVSQVITTASGATRTRRMPGWMNAGSGRLRDFGRVTVRNSRGRVVGSHTFNFCPDTNFPERTGPGSAAKSSFPSFCSGELFQLGMVSGIARGWAVDPALQSFEGQSPFLFKLPLGTYHVTETIQPGYARFFGIPARDTSATVIGHVVKGTPGGFRPARRRAAVTGRALPSLPRDVPLLRHVPADALPDLVPLPSWDITTSHVSKTRQDFLDFGATVWVGGHSPLDVQGFRTPGSTVMKAYQYYRHDGRIVGRTRAGTMFFDNQKGHHHWHFQQFAKYVLVNASKKVAVRSEKVGFCIGPTDAIDLTLPHADWNPPLVGLTSLCGQPTALWVQEYLQIGWGDTYSQLKAGQAFNITHLPDGTYYIEIIANPEHLLHEVTRANDVSLRKVIITGPAGHRHVRVPAWHGIDPEG